MVNRAFRICPGDPEYRALTGTSVADEPDFKRRRRIDRMKRGRRCRFSARCFGSKRVRAGARPRAKRKARCSITSSWRSRRSNRASARGRLPRRSSSPHLRWSRRRVEPGSSGCCCPPHVNLSYQDGTNQRDHITQTALDRRLGAGSPGSCVKEVAQPDPGARMSARNAGSWTPGRGAPLVALAAGRSQLVKATISTGGVAKIPHLE